MFRNTNSCRRPRNCTTLYPYLCTLQAHAPIEFQHRHQCDPPQRPTATATASSPTIAFILTITITMGLRCIPLHCTAPCTSALLPLLPASGQLSHLDTQSQHTAASLAESTIKRYAPSPKTKHVPPATFAAVKTSSCLNPTRMATRTQHLQPHTRHRSPCSLSDLRWEPWPARRPLRSLAALGRLSTSIMS
ncbi:hypothetical protein LY78DRAFT_288377 [Colletotrichum sublineola]|nr:hypothetical protein LY78DRAFT_288377 [Colletotrichum sublineola]